MKPGARQVGLVLGLALALGAGCGTELKRRTSAPERFETLDRAAPYLKAHMRDGRVYVLRDWRADSLGVRGAGRLLDANRNVLLEDTALHVPLDSVALFETNRTVKSGAATAITVMSGITAGIALLCATNPKACFGSCPTFYATDASGAPVLEAEGFSASIAPALEATDLDALYRARPNGRELVLRVTNEALETHVIRSADVIAVPRPAGTRVYATRDGAFYAADRSVAPTRCSAPEGDCAAALAAFDGVERFSAAHPRDLAARETVELEFDASPADDVALVITERQTLMTTYLVYQALAYLGSHATGWLASLENASAAERDRAAGVGRVLGGIDILVEDDRGGWRHAGTIGETGPIAWDTKLVPLPRLRSGAPLRVRLRMTQGLWRIDQVQLVRVRAQATPLRVPPALVRRDGAEHSAALRALRDSTRTLVTMPGDAYELVYALPPGEHELFLEARGYYLEWMRQEWLEEENLLKASRFVRDPAGALRALAPAYKRQEAGMEHVFWNSRYAPR